MPLLIPAIIIGIIGLSTTGFAVWVLFTDSFRLSNSASRVLIFGFFWSAIINYFSPPKTETIKGWQKNLTAIFFLLIGLFCLYASWLAFNIR